MRSRRLTRWVSDDRGQGNIMMALALGAIVMGMGAALMSYLNNATRSYYVLRNRSEILMGVYDAAQIVKQAYYLGKYSPGSCPSSVGSLTQVNVGSLTLCFPSSASDRCVQGLYCVQTTSITAENKFSPKTQEEPSLYARKSPGFHFLVPEAHAGLTSKEVYLANIPAITSPTITVPSCPSSDPNCIVCQGGGSPNADCLRFRVCLKGMTSCSSASDYVEARVAFTY